MIEEFGKLPNGDLVNRVRLTGGGLTANVLTYGAILQDLRLEGHGAPLVLGLLDLEAYFKHSPYFGATAGRCANRIRGGHLELDGTTYQLNRNFLGKHCLHGGQESMGKQLWRLEECQSDKVEMSITLADGHMGFPGKLHARLIYSLLPDGVFDIQLLATCDSLTLCNLAHHSYWTLDDSGTVREHVMQIDAQSYLPVDKELIPTGEVALVADTQFDFRNGAMVKAASALDHNFCISNSPQSIRKVASLKSLRSGIELVIRTTEPGLQVYSGERVDVPVAGLSGEPMGAFAGIAIEPQRWPDANHHPKFAQATLKVGEAYRQHTQFKISKET
ncbi:aldose epimerase family protein [Pseudopelagicola sp. nBUS_19]|uniref:aldose epimerase family protein n=1 Tax=unclassified Pseudopelagicola TaxID=2649563 RepID=UPI003EB98C90